MYTTLAHTNQITFLGKLRLIISDLWTTKSNITLTITEPFTTGRSVPWLLFNFSIMALLLKPSALELPTLDSSSDTGWISRFRDGETLGQLQLRLQLTDQLAHANYWDRVIFYVDKSV
jgi:hypothetical protein